MWVVLTCLGSLHSLANPLFHLFVSTCCFYNLALHFFLLFLKLHRKITVLESRFNKVGGPYKKDVLKNVSYFTGKQLCRSLFLMKLQALRPTTLLRRNSNAGGVSCEISEIFKNTFFTEPRWRSSSLIFV